MTRGDFAGGGSPEASHEQYAAEMTKAAAAEADYDPWAEPEPAPGIRPEDAREYIDRLVASWQGREDPEPEREAEL